MILIHRLTPFAIGIVLFVFMTIISFYPLIAPWALPLMLAIVCFLIARLADYRWREKDFWGLIATPVMFVLSAGLLFILADDGGVRMAIAVITAFLAYFYEEHLFRFVHLPASYQAYGLQNTSGIMSILSVFFFAAGGFAILSFVRVPLVPLSVIFFLSILVVSASAFWMAKVPREHAMVYALGAAVIFTELFAAGSYLPIPFMSNGALIAVMYYMYVGLARAHVLAKLSRIVIKRYVGIGALMLAALLATATWI